MNLTIRKSRLAGAVDIPGSKSHTIRAVAIAAMAEGESVIRAPLHSNDTKAAFAAFRALGAEIEDLGEVWHVRGMGGRPSAPVETIDVLNSGTTLRIAMGACALLREGTATLTGDQQIQRRPAAALGNSLIDLGASVRFLSGNGCAPVEISGLLRGGVTNIEAVSSQYLTSLLMACPLAEGDSTIDVPLLNERPYVEMTLGWLERQGVRVEYADDFRQFRVTGGQAFAPVDRRIPADFSSGTFFLAAGALEGNEVTSRGLDMADTQGDKAVVDYLREMGADVAAGQSGIRVRAKSLHGCEIDLNATPDALPMLAALACFAEGETRLVNVPQARIKETDRIAVMREELEKLGGDVEELSDGIVVRQGCLRAGDVEGHDDHRVVMALAIIATQLEGETVIHGAEAAAVTYPRFIDDLRALGGDVLVSE